MSIIKQKNTPLLLLFILQGGILLASSNTISGIHYEIMKRCYDNNSVMYQNYGGKGITVCDEWHDREVFRQWCLNNGYKTKMKLKRKDSSNNYCPENCLLSYVPKKRSDNDPVPEYIRKRKEKEGRDKIRESYGVPKPFSQLRIYKIYKSMIARCSESSSLSNSAMLQKKYYIDRGITVCDEWLGKIGFYKFYQWSMQNGYRDTLSIDRIDNDKGYSPDNCRWIPRGMQDRNKRNNVRYDYAGKKLLLIEICEKENVSYDALKYRAVKQGQDLDYAISEIRKHRARSERLHNKETNPTGYFVKSLRNRTGLTQKEFGAKYNISECTIQNWERGVIVPPKDKLNMLVELVDKEYKKD